MPSSPSCRLSELVADVSGARLLGPGDLLIHDVAYDSRRVKPGSLFVAVRGLRADGSSFVRDALNRGAVAVASEAEIEDVRSVPQVRVANARKALAEFALSLHGHPERSLTLTAITGTNGKTTVAMLLHDVLEAAGLKTGLAGTLGVLYRGTQIESPLTTPESADLAAHFAAMRDLGCTHVVMEASSIGIDLERVWGLPFRVAVFTNLSRDHLDYHGSVEAYREAKLRLFREQGRICVSVINRDDPAADLFVKAAPGPIVTLSLERSADYRASGIRLTRAGLAFEVRSADETATIECPLIGRFNVYNVLTVIACARVLGADLGRVRRTLRRSSAVRGRAEAVPSTAPFSVIVDYAHTPDALEKILSTLHEIQHNRILTVVGAGGNRDRGKRPLMAEIAARLSDRLILTSDNPRDEEPEAILDDMAAGLTADVRFVREADRKTAIATALGEAKSGDIVLIAGKGHETYQEVRGVHHPFDDRQVALDWLTRAGYGS